MPRPRSVYPSDRRSSEVVPATRRVEPSVDPARPRGPRRGRTRRPPPARATSGRSAGYRTPGAARPRRSAVNRCGAGVFPDRARLAGEAGTGSTPRSTAVKALAGCPRSEGRDLAAGPGQHLVVGGRGLQLLGDRVQAGDVRQTTCRAVAGRVACDANERRSRRLDGLLVLRVLLIFRQFVDRRPVDVM